MKKIRITASSRVSYCRDLDADDDTLGILAHNITDGMQGMECDDFFLRPNHDVSNEEIDSDEVSIYVQDGIKRNGKPNWKEVNEATLKKWAKEHYQ